GRLVEAGDAVEHRGLAGAIGANDGGDLARAGAERDVVDRQQAAEAHRQMLDFDQRHDVAHGAPPRRTGWSLSEGSRWAIRPRGRNTMISTMASPKAIMR